MGRYDALLQKDPQPAIQNGEPSQPPASTDTPSASNGRVGEEAGRRVSERANIRTPVAHVLRRQSFEIYDDQMKELRRLSIEEKLEGRDGSMSRMVRDAINHYLKWSEGEAVCRAPERVNG